MWLFFSPQQVLEPAFLLTGRSSVAVLVWSVTALIIPSRSGLVSMTRTITQEPWGALASATNTMSPFVKFLLTLFHLGNPCISGRYFFTHLVQKRLAMYCTCLLRHWIYRSSQLRVPGGRIGFDFSRSRWFEVWGSRSLMSSDVVVSGRLFKIASTSHITVERLSSSRVCCLVMISKNRFNDLISLSQTPLKWAAAGGLTVHFTPFSCKACSILCGSNDPRASLNSLLADTKLVPLSDHIPATWPLRQIKCLSALIQESVSKEWATSRWTAWLARQVKIPP